MRILRWLLCLPAGLVASVIMGALTQIIGSIITGVAGNVSHGIFGGSGAGWYVWLVSGLASAIGFFWAAFRVAPARTRALKWTLVLIVGVLGLMAALGPLMVQREQVRAFAGVAMVLMAVTYSRMSVNQIAVEAAEIIG